MTRKSFIVILIASVLSTYIAGIIDALANGTFFGGKSGFPFKDTNSFLFGGTTYNYMLLLNIVFWFIVIFVAWKLLPKIFKK